MKPGLTWSIRSLLSISLCAAALGLAVPASAAFNTGAPVAVLSADGFTGNGFSPVPGTLSFQQVVMTAFPALPSGNLIFSATGFDASQIQWNLLVEITPSTVAFSIGGPVAGTQTPFAEPNGAMFDLTWSPLTVIPNLVETSYTHPTGTPGTPASAFSFAQPSANHLVVSLGLLNSGDTFTLAEAPATVSPVPEPSPGLLGIAGLMTIGLFLRKRQPLLIRR